MEHDPVVLSVLSLLSTCLHEVDNQLSNNGALDCRCLKEYVCKHVEC